MVMEQLDITQLCKALSLSERDGPISQLDESLKRLGERKLELSLVGRFITNKLVNREAFCATISRIWRTTQEVDVETLQGNIYAFYFKNQMDRLFVLAERPWTFDKALLVLEEPRGKGDLGSMELNKIEFWIQMHNAPLLCMTKDIGLFLGRKIGLVKEIDLGPSGDCVGKYIRVLVVVDITKPLRRCLKLDLDGTGKPSILLLRYERLPEYYFHCGQLGHTVRECLSVASTTEETNQNYEYGAWLRATSPVRVRRQQREDGDASTTKQRSLIETMVEGRGVTTETKDGAPVAESVEENKKSPIRDRITLMHDSHVEGPVTIPHHATDQGQTKTKCMAPSLSTEPCGMV
ncbi:hypothetical protein ACOSQ3_021568 [Xanthoceras sorbifolium]